jgi:hypothetical protein
MIAEQRSFRAGTARARHPFKIEAAAGNELAQSPGRYSG